MAPNRNCVCLINYNHRKTHPSRCFNPLLVFLALWCYVQNLDFSLQSLLDGCRILFCCLLRINIFCRNSFTIQRFHLISHQGYQRRENDRDARKLCCGKLIAKRFPESRSFNHQNPFSIEDSLDCLPLLVIEMVYSKDSL